MQRRKGTGNSVVNVRKIVKNRNRDKEKKGRRGDDIEMTKLCQLSLSLLHRTLRTNFVPEKCL